VCAKFVPHSLTKEQKEHRVEVSRNFVERADTHEHFLNKIVTGDESWFYVFYIFKTIHLPNAKPLSGEVRTKGDLAKFERQNRKSKRCSLLFSILAGLSITNLCLQAKR